MGYETVPKEVSDNTGSHIFDLQVVMFAASALEKKYMALEGMITHAPMEVLGAFATGVGNSNLATVILTGSYGSRF